MARDDSFRKRVLKPAEKVAHCIAKQGRRTADHNKRKLGRLPFILMGHFGGGHIEGVAGTRENRRNDAALAFE